MIHHLALAVSLLASLPFLGAANLAAETRVIDATGRTVIIPDSERIVAVGGAVTETIYALGLADRVVAVDSTSLHPVAATGKPNVGYMRQLAAEPILALEPSLLLADEDSGPPAVLDQLREAGLPVVMVPDVHSPQGVLDKIGHIAAALDSQESGLT